MESIRASQAANKEKIEQETEASLPVLGNGRKLQNAELKETGHSIWSSVNKFASQIKKPSNRRSQSPINWFPRKKTDSFLKRKIRLLQEGGGMSSSLVETLGNANPHYSRIAREKIAAQEAASKAMKARKTAMVEASWCRILQAARIQSKDAESKLEKAELCALESFEEAKLMGVMMFDRPDCPRRSCELQSSLATGEKSAHAVTASFETEFEVDREVAAAVKKAFIILANSSSSSNKEEFRDLLQKIRQNPDDYEALTASPQCEYDHIGTEISEKLKDVSHRKSSYGILVECHEDDSSNSSEDVVKIMVDRLQGLQEDELSSLATIVATCGLNAALLEMEIHHDHDEQGGTGRRSNANQFDYYASKKKKEDITILPSLDKFLVKHVSRLEREAQQAQISKKNDDILAEFSYDRAGQLKQSRTTSRSASDLGSILIKHVSKLEREIQEAKNSQKLRISSNHEFVIEELEEKGNVALELREITNENMSRSDRNKKIIPHDVKAKLKTRRSFSCQSRDGINGFQQASLDEILIKPVHWLERDKIQAMEKGNASSVKKLDGQLEKIESLDEILVKKSQSKSGRAKLEATQNSENSIKNVDARREARDREFQEAWGGLSLGNSLRPHLSKLEKDKAAWRRAEQEAKIRRREY